MLLLTSAAEEVEYVLSSQSRHVLSRLVMARVFIFHIRRTHPSTDARTAFNETYVQRDPQGCGGLWRMSRRYVFPATASGMGLSPSAVDDEISNRERQSLRIFSARGLNS